MSSKGKRITYIVIAAVLVAVLILLLMISGGVFRQDPEVEIAADNCYDKTLHVVTDEDYRPYSFYEENGTYSGHDVELIAEVANKLHMNLDLWFMQWDEAIAAVTDGRADLLMTCDYSDAFAGSERLIKSEPVSQDDFIVYSKKRINSVDELYGMKIAIIENANVLTQLAMLNLDDECTEYSSNRKAMQAVIDDEADCAIMRNTIGNTLLSDPQLSSLTGYISIGKSYMCFGVDGEQAELAEQINEAIEELKTEGEISRLSDKWLSTFEERQSFGETMRQNMWIIAVFLFLIGLMLAQVVKERVAIREKEEEKNLYIDVIEKISEDFESVLYIGNFDDKPEDVTELRLSDKLRRNIPGWEDEKRIEKRFELMSEAIVVPEDRERFLTLTSRRSVTRRIEDGRVYYVNFAAEVDGEVRGYQIKFTLASGENGMKKGCIAGVHEIGVDSEEVKKK